MKYTPSFWEIGACKGQLQIYFRLLKARIIFWNKVEKCFKLNIRNEIPRITTELQNQLKLHWKELFPFSFSITIFKYC